jgi:hypothetical protein
MNIIRNRYTEILFLFLLSFLFFDYDIFLGLATLYVPFIIFKSEKFRLSTPIKLLIYLIVFLFFVIVRLLPIFSNHFFPIWNKIMQQNYLIGDGKFFSENIFLDLQLTLFSISCESNFSEYRIRYSSDFLDSSVLTCPYDTPYGYVLNFIPINLDIWNLTLFISTISLLFMFLIYFDTTKHFEDSDFLIATLLFLSPPVNFLLFRLNIDIFIFFTVYLFLFKRNTNYFVKSLAIFITILIKFYGIAIIILNFLYEFLHKLYFQAAVSLGFIFTSFFYLFFFESNSDFLTFFNKPIESNINYGIFNDSLYISQIFQISQTLSYVFLIFLIILFLLIIPKESVYMNLRKNHLGIISLFLLTALFTNFDYRLVFLVFLIKPFLSSPSKVPLLSMMIFMFTSPSLVHAYEVYYKIIRNDEIYFLDFSFYFFIALCLKIFMHQLLKLVNKTRT